MEYKIYKMNINEKTYIVEIPRFIYILIKKGTIIDADVSTQMFILEGQAEDQK